MPASLDALSPLLARVVCACQHAGLSTSESLRVELVIEEIFTNTIDHGYAKEVNHRPVWMALQATPGELHIAYIDAAPAFNPVTFGTPSLDLPMANRQVGGLGLILLAKIPRSCSYRYENGHNVLDMLFCPEYRS